MSKTASSRRGDRNGSGRSLRQTLGEISVPVFRSSRKRMLAVFIMLVAALPLSLSVSSAADSGEVRGP
jgi:hypothetical protein